MIVGWDDRCSRCGALSSPGRITPWTPELEPATRQNPSPLILRLLISSDSTVGPLFIPTLGPVTFFHKTIDAFKTVKLLRTSLRRRGIHAREPDPDNVRLLQRHR
ncbi:hypothetical protein HYQ46_001292 [Verticillium longisporum]|nr:hypothetical protein HYQ46_001292 [Verticillium longisporum]